MSNIKICQLCKNREFDPKQGIVCSLTAAKPTFVDQCADYIADQAAVQSEVRARSEKQSESINYGGSNGFGGVIGGSLAVIGGVAWLIGGIAMGRIFFYPFILIIGGIIGIVKGSIEASNKKKFERANAQHLDNLERDLLD